MNGSLTVGRTRVPRFVGHSDEVKCGCTPDSNPSRDSEEMHAESRCQNCGAFVTERFSRVFGDNRNRVHGCFDCMTATEVKNGLAIGP